jgi:hypothetical protein
MMVNKEWMLLDLMALRQAATTRVLGVPTRNRAAFWIIWFTSFSDASSSVWFVLLCRRRPQMARVSKQQTANSKQQAASRKPQAARRKPQAASRKPQAASRKQQAASSKQQAASRKQQAASSKQQAASSKQQRIQETFS